MAPHEFFTNPTVVYPDGVAPTPDRVLSMNPIQRIRDLARDVAMTQGGYTASEMVVALGIVVARLIRDGVIRQREFDMIVLAGAFWDQPQDAQKGDAP